MALLMRAIHHQTTVIYKKMFDRLPSFKYVEKDDVPGKPNIRRVHEWWEKEDKIWQDQGFLITPEFLEMAKPFPHGWSSKAGIKVLEEADLDMMIKKRVVEKLTEATPGDYRELYEGAYAPVELIFSMRKSGRYYLTASVPSANLCCSYEEPVASALDDLIREIPYLMMQEFALGLLPEAKIPKTWEEGKRMVREAQADDAGEDGFQNTAIIIFLELHFPANMTQCHLDSEMSRLSKRGRKKKTPLPVKDKLTDFLMSGEGLFLLTWNVDSKEESCSSMGRSKAWTLEEREKFVGLASFT